MLGEKIRYAIRVYCNSQQENGKEEYEELDELIKASEERDTLKTRVDELEKENFDLKIYADICLTTTKFMNHGKLKKDALLGEALRYAFAKGFNVQNGETFTAVAHYHNPEDFLEAYLEQERER